MKIAKIRSTKLRTAGKILLWIMISFIAVKGAVDIVMGNTITKQQQALEIYMEEISTEEQIKTGAMSFAEEFSREYLTFDGELGSDYETRLAGYTSNDLRIESPDKGAAVSVIAANAVSITFVDKQHVDVTVAVETKIGQRINKLDIMVPVATKGGLYVVDEYPQIVPKAETADISASQISIEGTEVSNAERDDLEPIVESFLKTYYGGSESELMYFLTQDSKVKRGIEGTVKFDAIDSFRAIYSTAEDVYVIDVKIKVQNSGVLLPQHLYLQAEQEGDRYYIMDIRTRI